MTGHQWSRPVCTAFAKSRGRPCQRRVGKRPDGSPHVVCDSHGAKTPPYEERPISAAGKQRIAETQRSRWAQYRADKAAGVPYVGGRIGRPPKPKPTPGPMPSPEQRRARAIAELTRLRPDQDWS
jgi:hypothetical protein